MMVSEQPATISWAYAIVGSLAALGSAAYTIYQVMLTVDDIIEPLRPIYYSAIVIKLLVAGTSVSPFLFLFRSSFTQCRSTAVVILLTIHSVLCIYPMVTSIICFMYWTSMKFSDLDYKDLIILLAGGLGLLMALLRGKELLRSDQPPISATAQNPVYGCQSYQPAGQVPLYQKQGP